MVANAIATAVFDFDDYKAFLRSFIRSEPGGGRGLRSRLAEAAGCQRAYISRVLADQADLSLEQAMALTPSLRLNHDEESFFLTLVQLNRAGTPKLQAHFRNVVAEARQRRTDLRERFAEADQLSEQVMATYYSAWDYLAVHVALSVPKLRTVPALVSKLGISPVRVREILDFLVRSKMAQAGPRAGEFRIEPAWLHLGRSSAHNRQHQINWRLRALRSIEALRTEDFHYSGMVSLSQSDAEKLRELWIQTIEKFNRQVAASPEETVRCIAIDFFSPLMG